MSDVSRILSQIEQGQASATEDLLPIVYDELRKLAARKLAKEKNSPSLQPTVLVHDAYLRLVESQDPSGSPKWESRGHFFAAAAIAMRRILVEHARRKHSHKHGGEVHKVGLTIVEPAIDEHPIDLIALDEALSQLAEKWPQRAELVQLRYFAGLTVEEASKVLGISPASAARSWKFAKAFLYAKLNPDCE